MPASDNISIRDKKYFEDFFKRYYQILCYFAFSFLKNKEISEDIVQNVFMNLLNSSTIHLNEEHLKHTLYKSIRNACINELKKNALHLEVVENIMIEESEEYDSNFFHTIVRVEIYREIIEAINTLPYKCGEIFKLAYLEQLDNGEIAKKLSISINTVKVQKNNAKKLLREQLKHLYPIVILLFNM